MALLYAAFCIRKNFIANDKSMNLPRNNHLLRHRATEPEVRGCGAYGQGDRGAVARTRRSRVWHVWELFLHRNEPDVSGILFYIRCVQFGEARNDF